MTNNNSATKLKLIFRMLPVLGILLIVFGAWRAVARMEVFSAPILGSIGLGVLLFLTLFVRAEVANIKYYLNVFVYSVAVATICIVGYLFARSHTVQKDLTKDKYFSLSEKSSNVLQGLKKNKKTVEVAVFTPINGQLRGLADLYVEGGKNLVWTYLDAKKEPLKTRQYGDNLRNGDVVIKCGDKKKQMAISELMDASYENNLTNAIIEVSRDKEIKVYFLGGHGELALEAPPQSMMRQQRQRVSEPTIEQFKKNLIAQALKTEPLNLVQTGFVPEDAAVLIIASPQSDISAAEASALERYLNSDGKLLVTLDVPRTSNPAMAPPLTNLKGLLNKFGVDAPEQIILDLIGYQLAGRPETALAMMNTSHQITSAFAGSRQFSLPLTLTRPVSAAAGSPTSYQVTTLLKGSPQSWTEDLAKIGSQITPPSQFNETSIGVAVSAAPPPQQPGMPPQPEPKGGMRMVVFGTSDLIADDMQRTNQVAYSLMSNAINWLTQQEDLIAIPPRTIVGTPLVLEKPQLAAIFFLGILLIPGVLFFGGMSYSLLRRRR